jgi:hypothetical protein
VVLNPSRPNAPDVLPKNPAITAPANSLIHLPQRDSYVVMDRDRVGVPNLGQSQTETCGTASFVCVPRP